jgi:exosome complex exonuclease RRP6
MKELQFNSKNSVLGPEKGRKIIMDQTQDFKSLQDQIQAALIATTRTSGQISSEDLGFQRSLDREVGPALDEQSERLLELSSKLLKSAASISELPAPILQDVEDVENNWRSVVDVVDSLLEKTDTCLDEYTGIIKRKDSPIVEQVSLITKINMDYESSHFVRPHQNPRSPLL